MCSGLLFCLVVHSNRLIACGGMSDHIEKYVVSKSSPFCLQQSSWSDNVMFRSCIVHPVIACMSCAGSYNWSPCNIALANNNTLMS